MLKVILISIAIAALGFIPLMGLPGGLVFALCEPLVYLTYGPGAFDAFQNALGPSMWALMLMLAIIWPVTIPISYWISQKTFGPGKFFSLRCFVPFTMMVMVGSALISFTYFVMNYSEWVK